MRRAFREPRPGALQRRRLISKSLNLERGGVPRGVVRVSRLRDAEQELPSVYANAGRFQPARVREQRRECINPRVRILRC